jgi:hypothetical protein
LLSSSILRSGGSAQVDDDKDDVDNDDAILLSQRDLRRRENDDDMPPPRPKRWKAIPEKTKALIFIHCTGGVRRQEVVLFVTVYKMGGRALPFSWPRVLARKPTIKLPQTQGDHGVPSTGLIHQ